MSAAFRLRAGRAVIDDEVVDDAALVVTSGVIERAGRSRVVGPEPGIPTVEVPWTLVPGFVDAQINGAAGEDFMRCEEEGWRRISRYLLSTGTTSFLPTLISAPLAQMLESVAALAEAARKLAAPRALGIHLEGPLLSAEYPGAHDRAAIEAARPEHVLDLVAGGGGAVRMVTLAPERPGAVEVVAALSRAGVVPAIGHTAATFRQVEVAVERGARAVTHLFNAQRGLHHREPGVPGAALALGALRCGLILDGLHVHPAVAAPFLRILGARAFLVTDAVAPAGLPPGRHSVGAREVRTESGAPRLPDGTLFGSTLSMDGAFARAVRLGFSLVDAVRWTATVPAGLLGRSDLGRLAAGARADIVALDDDLRVRRVWVDGAEVFAA